MEFLKRMNELHYVHVAYDDRQLRALVPDNRIRYLKELGTTGLDGLILSLRNFILKYGMVSKKNLPDQRREYKLSGCIAFLFSAMGHPF